MSERQSERARQRWDTLTADERRAVMAPAVAKSVERRRRTSIMMNAFTDALEAAGLVLVPADDERAET